MLNKIILMLKNNINIKTVYFMVNDYIYLDDYIVFPSINLVLKSKYLVVQKCI